MLLRFLIIFSVSASTPTYAMHLVPLSESGAILYYNAPAAIAVGATVYASWISGRGEATLAKIKNRKVVKQAVIHRYDSTDDHAAPSIISAHSAILFATAHHSSDLFVYRVSKMSLSAKLMCHLSGSFSYPRWTQIGGKTLLFIRTDGNGAGDLSVIEVSRNGCLPPKTILSADKGDWLYVTIPSVFDDRIWFAWSIYNQKRARHEGVFATSFDKRFNRRDYTLRQRSDSGPELLAWSIRRGAVEYVEFTGTMECCGIGSQQMVTSDLSGRIRHSTIKRRMPLYPSWSNIPSKCGNGGLPFQSQPIAGSVAGMIGSEILSIRHKTKVFDSSVFLCVR